MTIEVNKCDSELFHYIEDLNELFDDLCDSEEIQRLDDLEKYNRTLAALHTVIQGVNRTSGYDADCEKFAFILNAVCSEAA
jgi:hypothetical protein